MFDIHYKHTVIPDAQSAIRDPGANALRYDPLGSGFSLREPQNDEGGPADVEIIDYHD